MGISRQLSDLGVWLVRRKPPPSAVANEIGSPQNSTVAGHARAHRRPKWVPHYGVQVDSGRAQEAQATAQDSSGYTQDSAQALPRLRSGILTLNSGMLTLNSG
jgi:hypothetical protein